MHRVLALLLLMSAHLLQAQNAGIIPSPQLFLFQKEKKTLDIQEKTLVVVQNEWQKNEKIANIISKLERQLAEEYKADLILKENKKSKGIKLFLKKENMPNIPVNRDQAYRLVIDNESITIVSKTDQGAFYGITSLMQMLTHYHALNQAVPLCEITDYPILSKRGWMDDINRGPIPTVDFVKEEILQLSALKMNCFTLYTESVFKTESHPDVAPIDGFTAAEITDIEEFAALHFVEMIPNQQMFGHMEKMLRNPFYEQLGDDQHILNPSDPNVYKFIEDYIDEIAPLYRSNYFHINCDETENLGGGRAQALVESIGQKETYLTHIQKVNRMVEKHHKQVMMWADILLKESEMISQLPKSIIPVFWAYHAAPSFAEPMKQIREQGFPFWIAPGTSSFQTIAPNHEINLKNIAVMTRDGALNGASGMLNTSWDDSGEALFQSLWHAHAWGAEMGWKPCKEDDPAEFEKELNQRLAQFNRNYSLYRFGVEGYFETIEAIAQSKAAIQDGMTLCSHTWRPLSEFWAPLLTPEYDALNLNLLNQIPDLRAQLSRFVSQTKRNQKDLDFLSYVVDRYEYNALRNRTRKMIYDQFMEGTPESLAQLDHQSQFLKKKLHTLKLSYQNLWKNECRVHFFDEIRKRYDRAAEEINQLPYQIMISAQVAHNTPTTSSKQSVEFKSLYPNISIYYTTDGSTPNWFSEQYRAPFPLTQSSIIKTVVYDSLQRPYYQEQYLLQHLGVGNIVRLHTPYSTYLPQYSGGSAFSLGDGLTGGSDFRDGRWQGYWGEDIAVEYDFGSPQLVSVIEAKFHQHCAGWILAPDTLYIYTSTNGIDFQIDKSIIFTEIDDKEVGIYLRKVDDLKIQTRYLRIIYKNKGALPAWHGSAGADSYLFCDEIIIR